jgi:hypothetical protein
MVTIWAYYHFRQGYSTNNVNWLFGAVFLSGYFSDSF